MGHGYGAVAGVVGLALLGLAAVIGIGYALGYFRRK